LIEREERGGKKVRWGEAREREPEGKESLKGRGAPSRGPGGGAGEPSAAGGRVWERTGGPKGEKRDKGQSQWKDGTRDSRWFQEGMWPGKMTERV